MANEKCHNCQRLSRLRASRPVGEPAGALKHACVSSCTNAAIKKMYTICNSYLKGQTESHCLNSKAKRTEGHTCLSDFWQAFEGNERIYVYWLGADYIWFQLLSAGLGNTSSLSVRSCAIL